MARVQTSEVDLVRGLVFEVRVERLLQAGNTGIDKLAQIADWPDYASRVEVLGIAVFKIAVTRLGSIYVAGKMGTRDLGALRFVERRPAHFIRAPEQRLPKPTLVQFLDRQTETVRQALVRVSSNLEVALDDNLGRKLSHDIVAVAEENKVVIVSAVGKFVEVFLDRVEFRGVSGRSVVLALALPADHDGGGIPVRKGGGDDGAEHVIWV